MTSLPTMERQATPSGQLRTVFTELVHDIALEVCQPIDIDINISQFLSDITLESLLYRKEEWIARGIDPSQISKDEISKLLRPSLSILLSEAKANAMKGGREHLLLIDIMGGIYDRWCKIFPFCGMPQ